MKFRGKLNIAIVFFLFLQLFLLSAENAVTGNKLCNGIYNYFNKKHLDIITQGLSSSDTNEYPYNIILKPVDSDYEASLIYIFTTEDADAHKNLIENLYHNLENREFNSVILISYGENLLIPGNNPIRGSEIFFNELNTNQNITVINVNLNSKKNSVFNGSSGYASPSWLTKAVLNSYTVNKLTSDLDIYYISQQAQLSFNNDYILHNYLQNSIPAITVNFKGNELEEEKITNTLCSMVEEFSKNQNHVNDTHYMILRLFNKVILFSEYLIVEIISIILLITVGFIFILGLVNKKLQNEAWEEIKKNWYVIPVTFLISILSFYAGRGIYLLWINIFENSTAFGIVILQIAIALFAISIFYFLETFFHKSYGERSLDFLIVIGNAISLFIFAISDISLFPLYLGISILAVLSLILKKNYWHIILFVLMIFINSSYASKLYFISDATRLRNFLYYNHLVYFYVSLAILPMNLMWLRILTAVKIHYAHNRRLNAILLSSVYVVFITVLSLVNHFVFRSNDLNLVPPEIIQNENSSRTTVSCTESKIFEDTIRNIQIKNTEPAVFIQVLVNGKNVNPIIYSASDFVAVNDYTSQFLIPSYPPTDLYFSYGTVSDKNEITVNTWYPVFDETDEIAETEIQENSDKKIYNSNKLCLETVTITAGGEK